MLDAMRLDGAKRLIEKRVTQVAAVVWLSGLLSLAVVPNEPYKEF